MSVLNYFEPLFKSWTFVIPHLVVLCKPTVLTLLFIPNPTIQHSLQFICYSNVQFLKYNLLFDSKLLINFKKY